MYDLQRIWKVSAAHRDNPRTTPISIAHIGNRFILLEKDGLPESCRCILQIHFGEEIAKCHLYSNVHGSIYDCHRQFLQQYSITHQTSSPNHPRSKRFVEGMFVVAKKLIDRAKKEGKPWISGLFDYRTTPQSGSIASPLQLMTQCTPR